MEKILEAVGAAIGRPAVTSYIFALVWAKPQAFLHGRGMLATTCQSLEQRIPHLYFFLIGSQTSQ